MAPISRANDPRAGLIMPSVTAVLSVNTISQKQAYTMMLEFLEQQQPQQSFSASDPSLFSPTTNRMHTSIERRYHGGSSNSDQMLMSVAVAMAPTVQERTALIQRIGYDPMALHSPWETRSTTSGSNSINKQQQEGKAKRKRDDDASSSASLTSSHASNHVKDDKETEQNDEKGTVLKGQADLSKTEERIRKTMEKANKKERKKCRKEAKKLKKEMKKASKEKKQRKLSNEDLTTSHT